MRKNVLLAACALGAMLFMADSASAQTEVVSVSETEGVVLTNVPCKTNYYSTRSENWFIQIGAGIGSPFVENYDRGNDAKHHLTANYQFAFGKWFSPYIGWRLDFQGGLLRWDEKQTSTMKYVTGNFDIMWDMFNSLGGVNTKRVFSIVPFVGLGGTFGWDYNAVASNDYNKHGKIKNNQWTLPVSAGLQLRFRLSKYVDFFAEGRAQFYGDNFNNRVYGQPVDVNLTCTGGFIFNLGGSDFNSYNPCDYIAYIAGLNEQVNGLRNELATTTAALAACEAQLPCPEVEAQVVEAAPLMATVRFKINSSVITPLEQVNVYNIAQWMKENPQANVAIVGYADKDTGTSSYNMALSERRAQAVRDMLVNDYGIDAARLSTAAKGSDVQPYDVNNWNRIVIFSVE